MTISSIDPRTGRVVEDVTTETTPERLDRLCAEASQTIDALHQLGRTGRAGMLRSMAAALEESRTPLVNTADRETALGPTRLNGELTRTCYQLRFFADVLDEGSFLELIVDHAGQTAMGHRPDVRRMLRPLGVVAVFGASNFPFAFSISGGDTASALAAGCPVIAKIHEGHPATSVATCAALVAGARDAGAPAAVVLLVAGRDSGLALVRHPTVRAVGFTGSLSVGRLLADAAAARPDPIPFYGEMGALNAVVICPAAASARTRQIAEGLVSSTTLGVGQFCTKPGLVFVPAGAAGERLIGVLAELISGMDAGVMLTSRVAEGYAKGSARLAEAAGVRVLASGRDDSRAGTFRGMPLLLAVSADALDGALLEECFGPVLIVVPYQSAEQLQALLMRLRGALTGTVHADHTDEELASQVLQEFATRVGRVVWNGFPTGVAVTWAMHHGGPFPATTDPLHTSVGATSIRRWLRPISYQDVPQSLLPPELRDGDASLPRRVDGRLIARATW